VASPEIVSRKRGPSVKHSLTAEFRTSNAFANHAGCPAGLGGTARPKWQRHLVTWVLLAEGGVSVRAKFTSERISRFVARFVKRRTVAGLTFGGLCRPAAIGDRCFVGTTCILRGLHASRHWTPCRDATTGLPVHHHRHCSRHLLSATPWAEVISLYRSVSLLASPLAPYLDQCGIRFLGFKQMPVPVSAMYGDACTVPS
jgi:hypothetical protein